MRKIESHELRFLAIVKTTSFEVWLKWICFLLNVLEINMPKHNKRIFGNTRLNMDMLDWNESIQTIPDFESQYQTILRKGGKKYGPRGKYFRVSQRGGTKRAKNS